MRLRELFIEHGSRVRVPKGHTVRMRGPSSGAAYLVVEGQIVLHASSVSGREYAAEIIGPGALIGLAALGDHAFHYVDATALQDCELMKLSISDFRREVSERSELCFEVLRFAIARLQKRTRQLQELAMSNLDARLAQAIITQFESQGVPVEVGARAALPTQNMLAKMLACSRESANKELQKLRNHDVVDISHRRIRINDAQRLRHWATFGSSFEDLARGGASGRKRSPAECIRMAAAKERARGRFAGKSGTPRRGVHGRR